MRVSDCSTNTNTSGQNMYNCTANTNTKDWECHIVVFVKSSADPWLSPGLWLHQPSVRNLTSIAIGRCWVKKNHPEHLYFFSCLRTFVGSFLKALLAQNQTLSDVTFPGLKRQLCKKWEIPCLDWENRWQLEDWLDEMSTQFWCRWEPTLCCPLATLTMILRSNWARTAGVTLVRF